MKRRLSLLLAALLLLAAACGAADAPPEDGGLSVVVTVFPEYEWARAVVGGTGAEVTLLMDGGIDMHSFQPSAADIVRVSSCDLFVYIGGPSDEWAEDALAEAVNPDMAVLDLIALLGGRAVEEELAEGMTAEKEDEPETDEHIWLSLRNAAICCRAIADALAELDPANAEAYAANADAYIAELDRLDGEYASMTEAAAFDTLLFADRFPFRYLTDDYGLTYYAAFAGCSAETEASFETVAFLSGKLAELGLPAVLIIDGSDGRIAETIVENAGADVPVLTLDSMQSATAAGGKTYLGIMENNLAVLDTALNG